VTYLYSLNIFNSKAQEKNHVTHAQINEANLFGKLNSETPDLQIIQLVDSFENRHQTRLIENKME